MQRMHFLMYALKSVTLATMEKICSEQNQRQTFKKGTNPERGWLYTECYGAYQ